MEHIGKRLKFFRIKAGLSQKEVANQAGISPSTYRDWEYGKQIKGEPYVQLAAALDITLTELLTGQQMLPSILKELRELEKFVESIRKNAAAL